MELIQNIATNLGVRSRKGLTQGLREFTEIDNQRALEVGHLSGMETNKVRRPKVPEGCPEVTVRESPDELTLRAEEVSTLKTYINLDHIEKERWCPLLVDYEWCAFCQEEAARGPECKSFLENEGSHGCRRRILRPHA